MSDGISNCRLYSQLPHRNFLELSCVPLEEDCAKLGEENYDEDAQIQCNKYVSLLQRIFPDFTKFDVVFKVKANPHDFGTYYEVVAEYEEGSVGESYALYVEHYLPLKWSDEKAESSWEEWCKCRD